MPDALDLMRTRRSPRIPDLRTPGPNAAELDTLLSVAARVPDHGKLVPWRFLVIEGERKKKLAAHAMGYGANWVTGWIAYERPCLDLLGVGANERVAGLIHIGTPKAPSEERPRPPLSEIVTRI